MGWQRHCRRHRPARGANVSRSRSVQLAPAVIADRPRMDAAVNRDNPIRIWLIAKFNETTQPVDRVPGFFVTANEGVGRQRLKSGRVLSASFPTTNNTPG